MSVPSQRRTSSHVGRRRSHDALKKKTIAKCPKCGEAVLPHVVCKECGTYKGRQILKIVDKKKPTEKKVEKKEKAK